MNGDGRERDRCIAIWIRDVLKKRLKYHNGSKDSHHHNPTSLCFCEGIQAVGGEFPARKEGQEY